MEIDCLHSGCEAAYFYKCSCSDEPAVFCEIHLREHIEKYTRRHIIEKYIILSQKEITEKRIDDLNGLSTAFESAKNQLLEKEAKFFRPKINKFLESLNSSILRIKKILNCLKSDEQVDFLKDFNLTYEQILSKSQEELNSLIADINGIKDIGILTSENSWSYHICEEEKDSDYKKLMEETKPLKFDNLYAYTILWFLDNLNESPMAEFFKVTNFCDKEKILNIVAENLNQKREQALFDIIDMTKKDRALAQYGSNAMSILVKAKCSFESRDFKGICIPQANLSYGIFYKTNFSDSDLSNCNLLCTQFLNVNLKGAILPNTGPINEQVNTIDRINSAEFSHDGSWIAMCQNKKIKIYDSYNSRFKKDLSDEDIFLCLQVVSWSYDDKYIASSDWNGITFIWNTWGDNFKPIKKIESHNNDIIKVTWAPDDYRIASYSNFGIIKVWNFEKEELIFQENLGLWPTILLWSYSGKYLAYYYGNECIYVCDSANNQLIAEYQHSDIHSLEWIFGETYLVFGGKSREITIWNFSTGKTFVFSSIIESQIKILKWNKKLSLLSAGNYEGSIAMWTIKENQNADTSFSVNFKLFICCHYDDVECLTWVEKNNLLASGGKDGTLKIWKIKKNQSEKKDQDTEEAKSTINLNENEADSIKISFYEELLWCTKASHFIKAEPKGKKFIIINSEN